jgi:hypothetical protein
MIRTLSGLAWSTAWERRGGSFARGSFCLGFVWTTVLLGVSVVAVIRPPATAGRILALDILTLILVALLALYADATRSPYTWTQCSSSRSWRSCLPWPRLATTVRERSFDGRHPDRH